MASPLFLHPQPNPTFYYYNLKSRLFLILSLLVLIRRLDGVVKYFFFLTNALSLSMFVATAKYSTYTVRIVISGSRIAYVQYALLSALKSNSVSYFQQKGIVLMWIDIKWSKSEEFLILGGVPDKKLTPHNGSDRICTYLYVVLITGWRRCCLFQRNDTSPQWSIPEGEPQNSMTKGIIESILIITKS